MSNIKRTRSNWCLRLASTQDKKTLPYPYLKDPHLYYHLESPYKIMQLLESGLYDLYGNRIVERDTGDQLQISQFTMKQISASIKQKHNKCRDLQEKFNKKTEKQSSQPFASPDPNQTTLNSSQVSNKTSKTEKTSKMMIKINQSKLQGFQCTIIPAVFHWINKPRRNMSIGPMSGFVEKGEHPQVRKQVVYQDRARLKIRSEIDKRYAQIQMLEKKNSSQEKENKILQLLNNPHPSTTTTKKAQPQNLNKQNKNEKSKQLNQQSQTIKHTQNDNNNQSLMLILQEHRKVEKRKNIQQSWSSNKISRNSRKLGYIPRLRGREQPIF